MSDHEWPYSHRELPIVARIVNETTEFVQISYRHRSDPEASAHSIMLTKEDFGARYHFATERPTHVPG